MIPRGFFFFPLLLALCGYLSVSCSQQSPLSSQERIEKQILYINMTGEPPSLDPAQATDTASAHVLRMLFDGLTRIGLDHKPHLSLAKNVDISPDRKHYVFHLRDSLWSNGDPLTARDFEYSWKRLLDPKHPSPFAYKLFPIQGAEEASQGKIPMSRVGITAEDEKTLRVNFTHPVPYFLELLATHTFFPVHKKSVESTPHWAADSGPFFVTNGPFRMKQWDHHSQLLLEKSPSYWDAQTVKIKKITLGMIEDANTELNLYEEGQLDFLGQPLSLGPPSDALPSLKEEGKLHFQEAASIYWFLLNTQRIPLNNTKVRRALSLAINRQLIIDHIVQGGQTPALGILPPGVTESPQILFSDASTEEAKVLFEEGLQELGLSIEELPPLELSYNSSEGHQKIAQAIQQQWHEALGFWCTLQNYEWKVYVDKIHQRDFDIGRLGWVVDFLDPLPFLEIFGEEDQPNNSTNWVDETYAKWIEESEGIVDKKQRAQLLQKAHERLIREMPMIPLYFHKNTFLQKEYLKDVLITQTAMIDFKWAYHEAREISL